MNAQRTIRTATAEDAETLQTIAVEAKMFAAEDVGFLGDRLRGAGDGDQAQAQWVVLEQDGQIVAGAYFAPEPFADRMWNLYFIAVTPPQQGSGVGAQLMAHVEDTLRARGEEVACTLVVETSSTAQYERTRAFYRKLGYDEEARIRRFYGPHDDKIVFWKSLVS